MFCTHNFQLAKKSLNMFFEAWDEKKIQTVRAIAIQALADLQTMSPVDTGLYRASHTLSLHAPQLALPYGAEGKAGKMSTEAMEQVTKAKVALPYGLKIPKGGMSVYITNNLSYASALEHGHSMQAPHGIYGIVEQLVAKYIEQAKNGG